MPSPQVIEKLQNLQVELDKISDAVKHIEKAAKVAESSSDILKQIPELIKELKSVEESHRKELQKFHKEKIDEVSKQLNSLLAELRGKAIQLSQVIEEAKRIEKTIADYFTEIKKINFPERLDKIDNQISSINIGVGNLQTSIQHSQEKIEKGFSATNEEIKHSSEKIISSLVSHANGKTDEIIKELIEQNRLLKREIKTNKIIQLVGLGIILAILTYLSLK